MAKKPTSPPRIGLILLAAGASSRMQGEDKLLKSIEGMPLLRRATLACVASAVAPIIVVLRPDDALRRAAICDLKVSLKVNNTWEKGMATSIKAGLYETPTEDFDGVIIALADMPDIGTDDINRLISAFDPGRPKMICRATNSSGKPGNPVLFGRAYIEALGSLKGDRGGKKILSDSAAHVVDVPLLNERAVTDLDRPEDWVRYFS